MKTLFLLLFCFFLSSCFFLFHLVYSEQKEYYVGNKDGTLLLNINNKYPTKEERIVEYNELLCYTQKIKAEGGLIIKPFLYYLGDSTKFLDSIGLDFKKVKLEYQDTIFSAIRFYKWGSDTDETFIDILEKDQKIYRVFEGQTTIGKGFKEVKIREIR